MVFLFHALSNPLSSPIPQLLWVFRLIYAMVMLFAKTAILLEWKNLFAPRKTSYWFFWACIAMIVVNVIAYTVAIVMTSISCIPIQKVWSPWIEGVCRQQKSTDIATTWINLAMDVVILLLPQPIIWRLKVTRQRRIGVSLIFSMGLLYVSSTFHHSFSYMSNLVIVKQMLTGHLQLLKRRCLCGWTYVLEHET